MTFEEKVVKVLTTIENVVVEDMVKQILKAHKQELERAERRGKKQERRKLVSWLPRYIRNSPEDWDKEKIAKVIEDLEKLKEGKQCVGSVWYF